MGIGRGQVEQSRWRGGDWFQPVLNIHAPFFNFLLFASLHLNSQKYYSYIEKIFGRHLARPCPPNPPVMPMNRPIVQTSFTVNIITDMSWHTQPDFVWFRHFIIKSMYMSECVCVIKFFYHEIWHELCLNIKCVILSV